MTFGDWLCVGFVLAFIVFIVLISSYGDEETVDPEKKYKDDEDDWLVL